MRTAKKAIKKVPNKNLRTENLTNFATKTAASITEAISRSGQFSHADGKVNVHIHVGDVILIGFDEAIDAEEWGMKENNSEIIGRKASSASARKNTKADVDQKENKKILRTVNFKKGQLQLSATEHSEPVKGSSPSKKSTKKNNNKTSRLA